MAEKKQFRAIKGVRDILPPESALWNWFEQAARQVFSTYGFQEIFLPVLEQWELFARSVGADTEIVSKEMFTVEDWPLGLDDPRKRIFSIEELDALEEAIKKGDLPDSDSNRTRPEELRRILRQMDAEQQRGLRVGETGKSWLGRFYTLVSEYVFQASSMHGHLLALRPEATASVVRAYIERGMHTWPGNVKLYYIGPMFRRERPQKGRYRQFYQIGAEVLGQSDHPAIDAELIEMLTVLIERCQIERATLHINSIGCKECRPAYVARLREALVKVKNQLGADSQRRIETNPLRVLDSKLPEEQNIIEKLPRITDHLCAACREHFDVLKRELALRGIRYEENWRLVRGLDYYMRTTFEITSPALGAQNALVGGGRYDGLVELLGGPPTKGIGFALGEDRFIEAIQAAGKVKADAGVDVFIAWIGAEASPAAVQLARKLRAAALSVELPAEDTKLKKSLGLADKLGARYAVLLGEDELKSGQLVLRRLADGEQRKLSESELIAHLKSEHM